MAASWKRNLVSFLALNYIIKPYLLRRTNGLFFSTVHRYNIVCVCVCGQGLIWGWQSKYTYIVGKIYLKYLLYISNPVYTYCSTHFCVRYILLLTLLYMAENKRNSLVYTVLVYIRVYILYYLCILSKSLE